jgi:hypothetical protein
MNILTFITGLVLTTSLGSFAKERITQQKTEAVGWVYEVKGTCYMRDDDGGQRRKFSSKNANGTKLHAGQELLCDASGSLKFRFFRSGLDVEITPQAQPTWYKIPNVPSRPLKGNADDPGGAQPGGRIANCYEDIPSMKEFAQMPRGNGAASNADATTGGTSTGATAVASRPVEITSPTHRSAVSPDTLVFRWKFTSETNISLDLSLRSVKTNEFIWKQDGVAIVSGELVSEEARAALKKFRAKNPRVEVKFSISYQGRDLDYVIFEPKISIEEEKALKEELSELDKKEGFLRLIGRADAFSRHGLFTESAQEYERALKASPESEDLQIAVVFAQCRADNWDRARQLGEQFRIPDPVWFNACILGSRSR